MKKYSTHQFLWFIVFLVSCIVWIYSAIVGDDLWLPLAFIYIGLLGIK